MNALPPEERGLLTTQRHLYGMLLDSLGRFAEAESLFVHSIAELRAAPGHDLNLAFAINNLATLHLTTGRTDEAESGYREASDIFRRIGERRSYASAVGSLGRTRFEAGDYAAADSLLGVAVEMLREMEPESGDFSKVIGWRGQVHHATGELEAAEREFREALRIGRRLQGDGVHLWSDLNNLAAVLRKAGKWSEAAKLFREALGYAVEIHGPDHFQVAVVQQNLAGTLARMGEFGQAETRYREAIRISEAALPPEHPNLAIIRGNLGECLLLQERWSEAAAVLEPALAAGSAALGEDHPRVARIAEWLEQARSHGAR
jgi:tetratricopeptide (TPR) repeat protein